MFKDIRTLSDKEHKEGQKYLCSNPFRKHGERKGKEYFSMKVHLNYFSFSPGTFSLFFGSKKKNLVYYKSNILCFVENRK